MSQAKVDRYKKEKANRKQIMKKEKMQNTVRKVLVAAVGLLLVCWIGYSAVDMYESRKPTPSVQINYQAFDDFAQELTEAAAEASAEEAQ